MANAKQPIIGKTLDEAMVAIERDNPSLKWVLPKDYARPRLDKQRLGQLIDLVGNIGLGDAANRSRDVLGRVYEYFLSQLTPGRYVGAAEIEDDGEPFEEKMERLTIELAGQMRQAAELELIRANLEELGYGLPAE